MKKITSFIIFAIILTVCTFFMIGKELSAAGNIDLGTFKSRGNSLALEDRIGIDYYIQLDNAEGVTLKLYVWDDVDLTDGKEYDLDRAVVLENPVYVGSSQYRFTYTGLAAKDMVKDIYAIAVAEVNGVEVGRIDVVKYSILRYCYLINGKLTSTTNTPGLVTLCDSVLAYGAAAQNFFNLNGSSSNPDTRLATDNYYQVYVQKAYLQKDKCKHGLFKTGEEVTIVADVPAGKQFAHWTKNGVQIEGDATMTVTAGTQNDVYVAFFTDANYTVTATNAVIASSSGTVSSTVVAAGGTVSATADDKSSEDMVIDYWQINGQTLMNNGQKVTSRTVDVTVNGNTTINVVYKKREVSVALMIVTGNNGQEIVTVNNYPVGQKTFDVSNIENLGEGTWKYLNREIDENTTYASISSEVSNVSSGVNGKKLTVTLTSDITYIFYVAVGGDVMSD